MFFVSVSLHLFLLEADNIGIFIVVAFFPPFLGLVVNNCFFAILRALMNGVDGAFLYRLLPILLPLCDLISTVSCYFQTDRKSVV